MSSRWRLWIKIFRRLPLRQKRQIQLLPAGQHQSCQAEQCVQLALSLARPRWRVCGNATRIWNQFLLPPPTTQSVLLELNVIPHKQSRSGNLYKILSPYLGVDQTMARWVSIAKGFDELVGYTYLGDIFLRDSKTGKFAVLFTVNPELVPIDVYSFSDFEKSFLSHPETKRTIFQSGKLDAIRMHLGNLTGEEIYIPVPFPFLGAIVRSNPIKKEIFLRIWIWSGDCKVLNSRVVDLLRYCRREHQMSCQRDSDSPDDTLCRRTPFRPAAYPGSGLQWCSSINLSLHSQIR
jgi:hypothetical protein